MMRTYGRLILLAVLLLGAPVTTWAVKGVGVPRAAPAEIFAAETAVVTVTAPVEIDPGSSPVSIDLMRVDERGKPVRALGRLYDDGTHGDAVNGDGAYTGRFSFNEPESADIRLVVTVAYRGTLLRTRSRPFIVSVRRRSSGLHRWPPAPDQGDAAQAFATPSDRFGVNALGPLLMSYLRRSPASGDSATWRTMFAPSLTPSLSGSPVEVEHNRAT